MVPWTLDAALSPNATVRAVTDEELVEAVRAGRVERFEELVKRHNQRLFRAVRSIVVHDHEAEDVVQHAYLRAFEHLDQFSGRAKFSTWLTRIAVHEALTRVRVARRLQAHEQRGPVDWQHGGASEGSPESKAIHAELRELIEGALDRLDDVYRTVLVLRDVEGMSTHEVAQSVGISQMLVRVRLHRARSQLRELLGSAVDARAAQPYAFLGERCAKLTARVMRSILELRS